MVRRARARTYGLALIAGVLAVALSAVGLVVAFPAAANPSGPESLHGHRHARVCGKPLPKQAACHAIVDLDVSGPLTTSSATPLGYGPGDLQAAYGLPSTTAGSGHMVAIVDAYDLPTAQSDLNTYRAQFGLPACGAGCFTKVNQNGGSTLPPANPGWGQEIALDMDMVSAACPDCKILLVEAASTSLDDLGAGVNTAVRLGAVAVSNSYGGPEAPSNTTYDSAYFNHPGVAITASSGDSGYGVSYPAASQYVTAVGGTSLNRDSSPRGFTESAWNGSGSGCSAYDPKPVWQNDTGCPRRTVADVAAVADPATGVAVYDSTPNNSQSGWLVFGGTSAAAPLVAATYALPASPPASSTPAAFPYNYPLGLHDITSGSNGSCGTYLCTAGAGYDGPTGLGTPYGAGAFTMSPPAVDRLTGGQRLVAPNGVLQSANGQYRLVQQSDGNLVEYGNGGVPFSTGTYGRPGSTTVMQSDGNLVTYAPDGTTPLFDTHTYGNPGSQAVLQNDGNLVVYAPTGRALWASYGPTDLLGNFSSQTSPKLIFDRQRGSNGEQYLTSLDYQRTARVGDNRLTVVTNGRPTDFATPVATTSSDFTLLEMQSDGNLVLSSCTFQPGNPGQYTAGTCSPIWSSLTYNNPGAHARMQTDGNLVVYTAGGRALWSSVFGRTY